MQTRDTKKRFDDLHQRRQAQESQVDDGAPEYSILELQRLTGNRAVVHLLASQGLQTKVRTDECSNKYEKEADRGTEYLSVLPSSQSPLRA